MIKLKPEDYQVSPYDVVDYLNDEKDIAAYLNAALADGNPTIIASALGDVARARGMQKISKTTGLNRGNLYQSLTKNGDPKLSTLSKLLKSLDLTLSVTPSSH